MKKLSLLAAAIILASCADDSPPNHFYLLTAAPPATQAQSTITISQIIIPAYLDRAQIVRHDGSALSMNEFERWGESFDSMVRRVLSADIATLPASGQPRAARVVIDDFAGDENGVISLSAHWTFTSQKTKTSPHIHSFAQTLPATDNDNALLTSNMSELLKRLAAAIADSN